MIGKTINGYKIVKKIGEGGMGEVYLAQNNLGMNVAIKILRQELAKDKGMHGRFRQECAAMMRLEGHPNIIQIRDIAEFNEIPCIIMEYLEEGIDLNSYVEEKGPISDENLLRDWLSQILKALDYAHNLSPKIIHRDIKPSNLYLTKFGQIKLLDFGIVKIIEDSSNPDITLKTLSSTTSKLGSLNFISPEQSFDSKMVDERSDIYSLGKTFKALITAGNPFVAMPMGQMKTIIDKCIQENPNDRFQSCKEVLGILQTIQNETTTSYFAEENVKKEEQKQYTEEYLTDDTDLSDHTELPEGWEDDFLSVTKFGEYDCSAVTADDLVLVESYNHECGVYYADGSGIVIPVEYDNIDLISNSDDYYFTVKNNGKWGLLRHDPSKGNSIVIPLEYDNIEVFGDEEEAEWFLVEDSSQKGIVYLNGEVVVPCRYSDISSINEDYNNLLQITNEKRRVGLFDTDLQREVVPCEYAELDCYTDGYIKIRKDYCGPTGLFSIEKAKIVLPCEYEYIFDSEDLYTIKKLDGKSGLFSKELSEIIIPCEYDHIYSDDYLLSSEPEYYIVYNFHNDIGRPMVINSSNEVIIRAGKYDTIRSKGVDNVALVKKNEKWGIIDHTCEELIPPLYDKIKFMKRKTEYTSDIWVKLAGKYFVIDWDGDKVRDLSFFERISF